MKFDKAQFLDTMNREFKDNVFPTIVESVTIEGAKFARKLVGKEYEIHHSVNKGALAGIIHAPGVKPIKIENKKKYFAKTFEYLQQVDVLQNSFRGKIKRITTNSLPSD